MTVFDSARKITILQTRDLDHGLLERNGGSSCFSKSQFMDGKFQGGLYLPLSDWKKETDNTLTYFDTIKAENINGNTIFICSINQEVLYDYYEQYIKLCSDTKIENQPQKLDKMLTKTITTSLLNDLLEKFKSPNLKVCKSILYFSYFHLIPNANIAQKKSSTRDSRSEFGVRGLHVDNWETPRRQISSRSRSGYKYIVNLGLEDRHFLYVDVSVEEINKTVKTNEYGQMRDLIVNSTFASPVADWFLNTYPNYPISRICLRPGMALLAPVQNIIHDGDLSEKTLPDSVGMISFFSQ